MSGDLQMMSLMHACPKCKFPVSVCRCGYDHSGHFKFTTSSGTVELKAQKCPVCGGNGVFAKYNYDSDGEITGGYSGDCHGCDGKGWVTV